MQYLKYGFQSMFGISSDEDGVNDSKLKESIDCIDKLLDRIKTSFRLEDIRFSVNSLRQLAKSPKYKVGMGAKAMQPLLDLCEANKSDAECVQLVLETLHDILAVYSPTDSTRLQDEEEVLLMKSQQKEDLSGKFTEMLAKDTRNINLLIELLEEFEFGVRWSSLRLLHVLLKHRPAVIQERVLSVNTGICKLLELVFDTREVIRNEALLVLILLSASAPHIQKILAFEGAFERIIDIVIAEGCSDGSVIVEDSLTLLYTLLKSNLSNQTLFCEQGCISKLTPFFAFALNTQDAAGGGNGWSGQRVANIKVMFSILQCLVYPLNPMETICNAQNHINKACLLQALTNFLMLDNVPADLLSHAINTLADVIRGNKANQIFLQSVQAPSQPPKSLTLVLLYSMTNEKQPFAIRIAVFYCFISYLHQNEDGQSKVLEEMNLDASTSPTSVNCGQLLCSGLFSRDPLTSWLAAISLSHALHNNGLQKEQFLRVQLSTNKGLDSSKPLMHLCLQVLINTSHIANTSSSSPQQSPSSFQQRLGILTLLCVWLHNCPLAVKFLLSEQEYVSFFIASIRDMLSLDPSQSEEIDPGNEDMMQHHGCVLRAMYSVLLAICIRSCSESDNGTASENIRSIVVKALGVEAFSKCLSSLITISSFINALLSPHPRFKSVGDVVFDHTFANLYKEIEADLVEGVRGVKKQREEQEGKLSHAANAFKEELVLRNTEIVALQQELESNHVRMASLEKEASSYLQQLQDLKQSSEKTESLPTESVACDQHREVTQSPSDAQREEVLARENQYLHQQLLGWQTSFQQHLDYNVSLSTQPLHQRIKELSEQLQAAGKDPICEALTSLNPAKSDVKKFVKTCPKCNYTFSFTENEAHFDDEDADTLSTETESLEVINVNSSESNPSSTITPTFPES